MNFNFRRKTYPQYTKLGRVENSDFSEYVSSDGAVGEDDVTLEVAESSSPAGSEKVTAGPRESCWRNKTNENLFRIRFYKKSSPKFENRP